MKFTIRSIAVVTICVVAAFGGIAQAQDFPEKDLSGIIMWGAGGATDTVARPITPLAEQHLGKKIILQNKPGATGAIATQWVYNQKSDGYSLLYGAENPQLYKVLELSQLDYADFEPIIVIARGVAVIVANNDTPWNSLEELIDDAKQRPGDIKMGTTGPGGLPFVVSALLKTVSDVSFTQIPFDGEGPGLVAMEGGHVDFSAVGLTAAREHLRAGRVKVLAVVADEPVPGLEEIPTISSIYPEYQKYLPWGPFYGVWAKRDIPEDAKAVLVDAFKKAFDDQDFQTFLDDFGAVPMGLSGEEADAFLKHWQSVSSWMMYDAGGAKKSPEEFGIPKVE